jgi:hypothetical protein
MENNEENKIQDGETFEEIESEKLQEEDIAKKSKPGFRSRLVLIFILGLLIGIAVKTEALKKITIGYDDYLMKIRMQSYNINGIQAELQKAREKSEKTQEQQGNAVSNLENKQNNQGEISDQIEN